MLQANPALTPNAVKAILQYTAQMYAGYDAFTQGAGFLNARGAVELARYFAAPPTAAVPATAGWSRQIIWGNQRAGRPADGRRQRVVNERHLGARRPGRPDVEWGDDLRGGRLRGGRDGAPGERLCSDPRLQRSERRLGTGLRRGRLPGLSWSPTDEAVAWAAPYDGDTVVWGTTTTTTTRSCGAPATTTRTRSSGAPTTTEDVVWGTQRTAAAAEGTSSCRLPLEPVRTNTCVILTGRRASPRSRLGERTGLELAPACGTALCRRRDHRRRVLIVTFFPTRFLTRRPSPRCCALVPHVGLEGQSAAPTEQWLDALGLLCRRPHGAAAARPAAGHARRRRGRVDAVHVQRQTAVSPVSHGVQHGGRSDHDPGHRAGLLWLGGAPGSCTPPCPSRSSARSPRIRRQHGPRRRRDRVVHPPEPVEVWHDDFLWSGPSFMVAGSAGAVAAVVIERGDHWLALLMLAPVYLTYRTYQVFLGRIEDQRRHVEETRGCTARRSKRC